jgi:hypothetical protein
MRQRMRLIDAQRASEAALRSEVVLLETEHAVKVKGEALLLEVEVQFVAYREFLFLKSADLRACVYMRPGCRPHTHTQTQKHTHNHTHTRTHTHTHTHTHTYYIYIYIYREREREGEGDC